MAVIVVNWLVTSNTRNFVYGQLTERVQKLDERTIDHGTRLSNTEAVLSGEEGHNTRLVRLEAWRLSEEQNKRHYPQRNS